MAERVVVVAVDGSEQADKAFACKYMFILFYKTPEEHGWIGRINDRDDLGFFCVPSMFKIQGAQVFEWPRINSHKVSGVI